MLRIELLCGLTQAGKEGEWFRHPLLRPCEQQEQQHGAIHGVDVRNRRT